MAAEPQINTGTNIGSVASGIYGDAWNSAEKFDKQTEAGIKKMESETVPKPPELKESPNPKDFHTDQMQSFGSAAMFLSAFGSLLTKRPLLNALNSGAEVMNAYHKSDAAAFSQAFDKWKVDNENSWKMANYNQELYKDVLGRDEAELKARAVSAKDNVMIHMADAKMAEQLYRDRQKQITKGMGANQAIVDYVSTKEDEAKANGMPDEQVALNKPKWFGEALSASKGKGENDTSKVDWKNAKDKDPVTGTGLTVGAIKQIGEGIFKTGNYSQAGLGMGWNPAKQAVDNYLAAAHPDFDRAQSAIDFAGDISEARKEGIISGNLKTAANLLDQSIPLLREASKNVDQNNWTDLNSFENYYKTHKSDPNLTKFRVALQTTMNDYTALGVRNGQTSDKARESTEKLVNEVMGDRSVEAFADQIEKEKKSVLKGVAVTRGKKGNAQDIFNDGGSKDYPMPTPKDNKYEVGKFYDLGDKGHGVHKYLGNGSFED